MTERSEAGKIALHRPERRKVQVPTTITDMTVGQVFEHKRRVTRKLIRNFAEATGYMNPIHLDEAFARKTVFKKIVAQGSLTVAILFGTMGTRSPGVGTIPVSQTLRFARPVLAGDVITIRLKVLNLDRKKNRVTLETVCLNQKGEEVLAGEALVLAPRSPRSPGTLDEKEK